MNVSIIGSGVIGQATGIGLGMCGNKVVFYDIDKKKLKQLSDSGYEVVEKLSLAVEKADVIFVCVPTPTVDGLSDFGLVHEAVKGIGEVLGKNARYKVVVVRSTVLPSTTRSRVIPLLERHSGLKVGRDFGVCINPEFLREKYALQDFLHPARIVIGEFDKKSGDVLENIYCTFKIPIIRTDLDTAEMIKYVSNLFLATKISFFNEIFLICQKLGLDANLVSKAVSLDTRIGEYGVYGGRPFDGKCLPKDLAAFRSFVKSLNLNPELLDAVHSVNERMRSLNKGKNDK